MNINTILKGKRIKVKRRGLLMLVNIMSTYRVFEPWDAHDPHHDPTYDCPEAEEDKLCGGVALVLAAVEAPSQRFIAGSTGGDAVELDNSDNCGLKYILQMCLFVTYSCSLFRSSMRSSIMFFLFISSCSRLSIWFCSCLISVRAISMSLPKNRCFFKSVFSWKRKRTYIQKVVLLRRNQTEFEFPEEIFPSPQDHLCGGKYQWKYFLDLVSVYILSSISC